MLYRLARAISVRSQGRGAGAPAGSSRRWLLASASVLALAAGLRLSADGGAEREADAPPRSILNRPWFDRFPEKATQDIHLWFWFAGGIALHEEGSRFKATLELFDFERSGASLDIRSLHDGRRTKTAFKIGPCDDRPPFDLCLDLEASPGGPRRLYTFGDEDDLAAHLPWALQARRAAEERARAPRP